MPSTNTKRKVGKRIGNTLYLHRSVQTDLPFDLQSLIQQAEQEIPSSFVYDIIKLIPSRQEVSFIHSPDWDEADEPTVGDSYKVNVSTSTLTFTRARTTNVQIYHHKWMFVKEDYTGFDVQASKRRSQEWEDLADKVGLDRKKIGNSDYWNTFVRTYLSPSRSTWTEEISTPHSDLWQRGVTWEQAITQQPLLFNGVKQKEDKQYVPHPTQVRNTVFTYQKLFQHIKESINDKPLSDITVLDASSGLGLGTHAGRDMGFNVEDVEPYPPVTYQPMYRDYADVYGSFDFIISNMVLNVIPQDLRDTLVRTLATLLSVGGTMFLIVRGRKEIEKQPSGIPFNPFPHSRIDQNGEYFFPTKRSYQKGFHKEELVAYLVDTLCSSVHTFRIEPLTLKNSGVSNGVGAVVTRIQ